MPTLKSSVIDDNNWFYVALFQLRSKHFTVYMYYYLCHWIHFRFCSPEGAFRPVSFLQALKCQLNHND